MDIIRDLIMELANDEESDFPDEVFELLTRLSPDLTHDIYDERVSSWSPKGDFLHMDSKIHARILWLITGSSCYLNPDTNSWKFQTFNKRSIIEEIIFIIWSNSYKINEDEAFNIILERYNSRDLKLSEEIVEFLESELQGEESPESVDKEMVVETRGGAGEPITSTKLGEPEIEQEPIEIAPKTIESFLLEQGQLHLYKYNLTEIPRELTIGKLSVSVLKEIMNKNLQPNDYQVLNSLKKLDSFRVLEKKLVPIVAQELNFPVHTLDHIKTLINQSYEELNHKIVGLASEIRALREELKTGQRYEPPKEMMSLLTRLTENLISSGVVKPITEQERPEFVIPQAVIQQPPTQQPEPSTSAQPEFVLDLPSETYVPVRRRRR